MRSLSRRNRAAAKVDIPCCHAVETQGSQELLPSDFYIRNPAYLATVTIGLRLCRIRPCATFASIRPRAAQRCRSRAALCRLDVGRPEKTPLAQRRTERPHRAESALEPHCDARVRDRRGRAQIRAILEIRVRPGIRKASLPVTPVWAHAARGSEAISKTCERIVVRVACWASIAAGMGKSNNRSTRRPVFGSKKYAVAGASRRSRMAATLRLAIVSSETVARMRDDKVEVTGHST